MKFIEKLKCILFHKEWHRPYKFNLNDSSRYYQCGLCERYWSEKVIDKVK